MHVSLEKLPAGAVGTDLTVKAMKKLIRSSLQAQSVRLRTLSILRSFGVDSHAPSTAARAIFQWVRSNIRYVNDPIGIETVQSPEITLRLKAGDCDDHAVLVAALAMSIGIPARIVVIGSDADHFEHVFAELKTDRSWQPADTTRTVPYGTAAPYLGAKKIFEFSESEGLGMTGYDPLPSVDAATMESAVTDSVLATLIDGWNTGKINRADVAYTLQQIDQGATDFEKDVWLKGVIRSAVAYFLADVDKSGIASVKASVAGLSGFFSFLTPIWNGVKKVVGWLFSGNTYEGVQLTMPSVQQPRSFTESISDFFAQNTGLVLVGGAFVAYLLLRKR
jgi:hypothetical protein